MRNVHCSELWFKPESELVGNHPFVKFAKKLEIVALNYQIAPVHVRVTLTHGSRGNVNFVTNRNFLFQQ